MLNSLLQSGWLRKARFPLIVFGLAYYLGNSLVNGENGYYAKQQTVVTLEERQVELDGLRTQRVALDKKVALLSPGNLDRDLLDEQARGVLGLADARELVIILPDDDVTMAPDDENHPTN